MGRMFSATVAIDIGSHSIKGAVVNSGRELAKYAELPTPEGALEGGGVHKLEELSAVVQRVWKELDVKNTGIISAISGQHVFVRQMALPAMRKKELDQAVRYQAEGQIPIPASEVVLDYAVINEKNQDQQIDVLVVATRRSVIQQLLQVFEQAGLQVKVFDLESLALARVLLENQQQNAPGGLDVIASIGATHTHISMFAGDVPRFTRSIPFGGGKFTEALALEHSIGLAEAEQLKLAGELPQQADNMLDDLTGEIRRSIDFYRSKHKGQSVNQIILAGGGANLNRLAEYIANRMHVPVGLGNPGQQVKIPKRLSEPTDLRLIRTSFAPSLGLAARGKK